MSKKPTPPADDRSRGIAVRLRNVNGTDLPEILKQIAALAKTPTVESLEFDVGFSDDSKPPQPLANEPLETEAAAKVADDLKSQNASLEQKKLEAKSTNPESPAKSPEDPYKAQRELIQFRDEQVTRGVSIASKIVTFGKTLANLFWDTDLPST